jgi:hypothetical protein
VQDIVAARLWLDLRHDEEKVNTANLIVIGEGEGARLGAIWLATEARRYKTGGLVPGLKLAVCESRDVCGAVWIDVRSTGRVPVKVGRPIGLPWELEQPWPPMLLLYNQNDRAAAMYARDWMTTFNQTAGTEKAVASRASSLLSAAGVAQSVQAYVQERSKKAGSKIWQKRGVAAGEYVWGLRLGDATLAKAAEARVPKPCPLDRWGFKGLSAQ